MLGHLVKTALLATVMIVVVFGGLLLIAPMGERLTEEPPLMLRPEHVSGPWPFVAPAVEISCCFGGRIGVVDETGQWFAWRPGDRHYDRFPITALGVDGNSVEAFGESEVAAIALAQERWPELNPR